MLLCPSRHFNFARLYKCGCRDVTFLKITILLRMLPNLHISPQEKTKTVYEFITSLFLVFTSPPPCLAFPAVYLNKSASARRLCGFQLGASVRLITSHTAGVCALSHACSDAPRCIHCQKCMHLDVQPGGNNLMTKQGQRVVGTNPYRLEGAD